MVGDLAHGQRPVPVQPAPGQAAQVTLAGDFLRRGEQVGAGGGVPQGKQKGEARQAGDVRRDRGRLAVQGVAQTLQAVGPPQGRGPQAVAAEARVREHRADAPHGLGQVDDQGVGAGVGHFLAQVENLIPTPQGVHQPAQAAVYPRLVGEAGVLLAGPGQGVPVHAEAGMQSPA